MGKENAPVQFYSTVGQRIKRWWKNLERYGFDISIAEFENKEVDRDEVDEEDEDEFFVGDPFVTGKSKLHTQIEEF
jgi:hypothetical protein